MIPLPSDIKFKIMAWLPHKLAGHDYPVIETSDIVPELNAPAITYFFSSSGTPSQFHQQLLRAVRNPVDDSLDDHWGGYYYTTMEVTLRHTDEAKLEAMWLDFYKRCQAGRRDLKIYYDRVRFIEILDSKPLPTQRLKNGQMIYWAQVSLRFEYEVSGISEAELIKRVNNSLSVISHAEGIESSKTIEWISEIKDVELLIGISAYVSPRN